MLGEGGIGVGDFKLSGQSRLDWDDISSSS